MIAAFERRLAQEITHPVFGYRLSYHRLFGGAGAAAGPTLDGRNSRTAGGGAAMIPVRSGVRCGKLATRNFTS
jgi:hypothetical protein